MALHTRKVVRHHIKPFEGAAAFAMQMRERGWRIVDLIRKPDVVMVTYERTEGVLDLLLPDKETNHADEESSRTGQR